MFRFAFILLVSACSAQSPDVHRLLRTPAPPHRNAPADTERLTSLGSFQPPSRGRSTCSAPTRLKRLRGKLDPSVVAVAREQLNLPMGTSRSLVVHSKRYLFCLEPHYHEPGSSAGPNGWHKGVTVYDLS